MICGYFTAGGNSIPPHSLPCFHVGSEALRFYHVDTEGFAGGFALHDRLPLKNRNIYFHDPESDILVLFSGYIYNRTEISGFSDIQATDPEPLVAARMFLNEGPDFIKRLNGDFAIFICRPALRRAYLFRDHAGIRPLSYAISDGNLCFSSDTRELCRFIEAGAAPDRFWLTGLFRYIDFFRTPSPGVKRLPPGHYLEFSREGSRLTRFWNPQKIRTDPKMQYETMLSDLQALLHDAVAIRCDRRFTAGAHVSSGLDSGIVATLARREYASQSSFYGYSWSPADFSAAEIPYDERDLVRSLCDAAGIIPVFSELTRDHFFRNIGRHFYNGGFYIEEETVRQASASGTNLIFSGWGGDEFISTGDRGIETDLLRHLSLRTWLRRNPVRPLKRFVRYFLEYTLYPALGILHPAIARSFARDARYLKKGYRRSERKALRNFYFHTSRRQMHLRYLSFYHLQERCETWTTMGYRTGVEYRYPLLDRRIIEYMIRVPSELLCRTEFFRPLLRILGEEILPDDVRLNNSKKDHLFSAWWNELLRDAALRVIEETASWSRNPDLGFIDFGILETDIEHYKSNPDRGDYRLLFKSLVNIKALHEFTVEFRKGKSGSGE
jgi:asparagine synthase (glutamine-hydrolysing)